jgi:hypothetical protein
MFGPCCNAIFSRRRMLKWTQWNSLKANVFQALNPLSTPRQWRSATSTFVDHEAKISRMDFYGDSCS